MRKPLLTLQPSSPTSFSSPSLLPTCAGPRLPMPTNSCYLRTLRVHHCTLFTCDPLPLYTLTTCRCGAGLAMQNESVAATCFGQVPKLLVQNRIREESQASPSFAVRACEWLPYALL